ncbi:unnamed protein product, partial [Tilletia controversa]
RIILKVNLVHDCIHHKCQINPEGKATVQERRETGLTAPAHSSLDIFHLTVTPTLTRTPWPKMWRR